ncbi:MAG TPA: hypothetical protein VKE69_08165, partial [Planctomycetota bacterium]|nr:hypothetical protein [Planctomycetota bacterium]
MRGRLADRLALAALAVVAVAAVLPSLLPGRAFVSVHTAERVPLRFGMPPDRLEELLASPNLDCGDQVFQVLPERMAFFRAVLSGELPLWWAEASTGLPLLGAPGSEVCEPRVLVLGAWLGPIDSLGWLAALGMAALGALTFLYLRLRGRSTVAALTGGIAFSLAGTVTANLYYACKVDALVLLPGGLAAIELLLRGRRALAFALLAACAADSALTGFPQNTALSAVVVGLFGAVRIFETRAERPTERSLRDVLVLGTAGVLGLAAGAIHLAPVVEAFWQSGRALGAGGVGPSLAPAHALGLLAPFALGDPTSRAIAEWNPIVAWLPSLSRGSASYNFTETAVYAGLATIPLVFAGLSRPRRVALPIAGLLIGLAVAAGSPLALLPGVGSGAPSRAIPVASFFLAVLAADGLDALVADRRARVFAGFGALALVLVAGLFLAIDRAITPESFAARVVGDGDGLPDLGARAAESWPALQLELRRRALLAAAAATAVAVACLRPRLRVAVALVLAADLVGFAHEVHPPRDRLNLFAETPAVRGVREAAAEGRIARVAATEGLETDDGLLFQASLPSGMGLRDTSAYVVFTDARLARLVSAMVSEAVLGGTYLTAFPRAALDGPLLDMLGVRVVLSRAPIERGDLEPIASRPSFHAYRRTRAPGRAWLVGKAHVAASEEEAVARVSTHGFDPRREVV